MAVFHVWAMMIGAGLLFVIWPNPFTFIVAFFIIGSRQHGLAILMHDTAHGVLFKTKALNAFAGKYLLATPYGGDVASYRKYHLRHHRYTQSEQDPDLPLSAKFPVTRASLTRKLFRDMTGQTYLRLKLATLKTKGQPVDIEGSDAFQKSSPWPTWIFNIALLGALAAMGLWWVYFTLWWLPFATWFFAALRLRNIAEHAMTSRDDNPLTHARTTYVNPLTRLFFAPYWVNYHVEHHVYMFVPCYRLRDLHEELAQNGHLSDMETKSDYRAVLKAAIVSA